MSIALHKILYSKKLKKLLQLKFLHYLIVKITHFPTPLGRGLIIIQNVAPVIYFVNHWLLLNHITCLGTTGATVTRGSKMLM